MKDILEKIIFFDFEIADEKISDIGAVSCAGNEFHSDSIPAFLDFLRGCRYICGHNILGHDLKYLGDIPVEFCIDTLYLSPLLWPKKPYHRLLKDDKLHADELNNPLNDAKKARDLFFDEVSAFCNLPVPLKNIFHSLLHKETEFMHFFQAIGGDTHNFCELIPKFFSNKICANAPIEKLAMKYPIELAYALAFINVIEYDSITPPWVFKNFPRTENVLRFLRNKKCASCVYCNESLDEMKALKRFFHYDNFRNYDGVPLQQSAVKAAVEGKSILAVFPTGGGKSITFQLPALMAGENEKGLTVVISPLQSLMKDQTDNLENQHNITAAVTINGSLDPLDRAKAIERVENGSASILYISPESLRSKSIERLLVGRNVVRFVIDEAHCFSAWGQDFRVDYLYIGEFVANLQKTKNMSIPCSCFTATAKPRVIADIQKYFRDALSIELEIFKASAARVNLSYHIFAEAGQNGKGLKLRQLLTDNDCPTIIYVSRTRRTEQLAAKLTEDGFPALAYHGQMDKQQRIANQDAFMNGEVKIIVATTAFGMGVDKKDIEMVIHYDISASLEDYVQEAGRAGRDENIKADCYVLYEDEDLNKHFNLLNQTKLSQKEIGQIWRALRQLTKKRSQVSQSALEIARTAGWDDSIKDMETRVKTAISALEQSGFVKRGQNMPRIFADSILVKTMAQARERIDNSARFDDASRQTAVRILSNLFSAKSRQKGSHDEGESRIEYISDRLGVEKEDVIRVIGLLREEKILSDAKDLAAHLDKTERGAKNILTAHINIENFLCGFLSDEEKNYNIKEIYEALQAEHLDTTIKQLGTVINYFAIKRLIKRTAHEFSKNHVTISPYVPMIEIAVKNARRHEIASFIINYLYAGGEETVLFSVLELKDEFNRNLLFQNAKTEEIEDALYYLLKIGAMKIDGGFLVIYNAMRLERLELGNKQYNKEHYAKLEDYYQNKRQQIHIVGEYANRLIEDYSAAMDFVNDYFTMDYNLFLRKYFRGRRDEISKNITPKKFKQIFGELSPAQLGIINDHESKYIVVAAGPGSGKTKLLTHKLASLYMMEDVKHEQMLMLTFSRAAATEFKKRLMGLIGNAANFIQITTFHSYCFDLLGKVGDLEKSQNIVGDAIEKINAGEVDTSRLTKTVLVIDEAQDMSAAEFSLVKTLAGMNEEMRIIAVGDDDQNIYEFRGSDSAHFASLLREPNAAKYELVENYRSRANIVEFANQFAETISRRLKTLPIMSKTAQSGEIHLTRLTSHHVEIPVVNAFLTQVPQGTTCIAARTNEEVLNIIGLLAREGIPARRITDRDDDGFNWRNIVELRDFAASFADESYTITDDIWASSKAMLLRKYAASADLPCILHLIADFEATNNKTKYKSDFWQFVRESKLDDFIADSETVLVSTIHKTKGREFDNVFLALGATDISGDASKRAIYVAITRAKKNLYVLFGGNYFNKINVLNKHGNKHGTKLFLDKTMYPRSERILFELGLGDVNLGDMKRLAKEIDLVSGQTLTLTNGGCCFNDKNCFFKFSKKFLSVIAEREANGYFPASAYINHIVLWHEKESDVEFKIILPCIEFARR